MTKKTRVLIIDDSALVRILLRGILSSAPDIEVIGEAGDPYEAREKIKALHPDVLTLDVEMPKMNGIEFLTLLMKLRPMPVIMISSLTRRGADITLQALEIGAVDTVAKPERNLETALPVLADEVILKVRAAAHSRPRMTEIASATVMPVLTHTLKPGQGVKLIAVGASTGGVEAIKTVLSRLPATMPPIVITQHMPGSFVESFATRLGKYCALKSDVAREGTVLHTGHIYVAPGDRHLELKPHGGGFACRVIDGEKVSGHKPSVDVMFRSVAEAAGCKALGVILTGMGGDGADGMLDMRRAGASTIGQSEASCVVYGMPKKAKELGAVEKELPLHEIAAAVIQHC